MTHWVDLSALYPPYRAVFIHVVITVMMTILTRVQRDRGVSTFSQMTRFNSKFCESFSAFSLTGFRLAPPIKCQMAVTIHGLSWKTNYWLSDAINVKQDGLIWIGVECISRTSHSEMGNSKENVGFLQPHIRSGWKFAVFVPLPPAANYMMLRSDSSSTVLSPQEIVHCH